MNNKPITIIREDFIKDLIDLCNNSGLPLFAIEDVLRSVTADVHNASVHQLEEDKKRYEEQQKAAEKQVENK